MSVKVTYLFGTGASHAELSHSGYIEGILMSDVVEGITR